MVGVNDGGKKVDVVVSGTGISGGGVNITEGLIAYYPFDGNADDMSGYNNHGTIHGGVTLTEDRKGRPNSAYSFNGTNGYIEVIDNPQINSAALVDNYTFSC